MRIGVPKEIKDNERRVALTPAGAAALTRDGHAVVVETGAGAGAGFADEAYRDAGAGIVATAAEAWAAELVVKVKEPIASEFGHLREDLVLFTYLHLAAAPELTKALLTAGTTGIAYETVQLADRRLPLLTPMSEIAGRLSVIAGAHHLLSPFGGSGRLAGGVAGVPEASAVVIGGGVAGAHAAANALGIGAEVTVLDISVDRLRQLDERFDGRVRTRVSAPETVAEALATADLVIGSVLVPGAAAPKVVTHEMVASMRPGSVLVDIAIDQGGCFEDSHPTTYSDPTFPVADALLYCVANMPGAVPVSSSLALTNATLPYVRTIAAKGAREALLADEALARGLNTHRGTLTNASVAAANDLAWVRPDVALG